jgi:hypothetical protein
MKFDRTVSLFSGEKSCSRWRFRESRETAAGGDFDIPVAALP